MNGYASGRGSTRPRFRIGGVVFFLAGHLILATPIFAQQPSQKPAAPHAAEIERKIEAAAAAYEAGRINEAVKLFQK